MKKIFAMSLAAVLSLSLLAGCTGKEQNGTPAGGQTGTPSVTRPASDYVGGPAGDYIQGYAEDPDAAELNATAILITVLLKQYVLRRR